MTSRFFGFHALYTIIIRLYAQTVPAKSYWIDTDSYGREINTGIAKERYAEDNTGNIHGKYISYYPNGKKEKVIDYSYGKMNGVYEEFSQKWRPEDTLPLYQ